MAKYIKKEIVDLNGSGSTKAYYKLKTWRRLDFDEFEKTVVIAFIRSSFLDK